MEFSPELMEISFQPKERPFVGGSGKVGNEEGTRSTTRPKSPAPRKPDTHSHEVLCSTISLNRISKTGPAYKIQLFGDHKNTLICSGSSPLGACELVHSICLFS